jgi:hypothetical protein
VRIRKTAITVAIVVLAAAGPVAAAISTSQASRAAAQEARAVARQLHASSIKLTGCSRSGSRNVVCHVEAHYRTGARRCTFDVVVQQGVNGQRPRTTPANFVCY